MSDAFQKNAFQGGGAFQIGAPTVSGDANFAGTATITFGQTGDLKAGAGLAGSTTVTFGQTGAFAAQGSFAATTTITFAQTGALAAAAALAGTATITFGQSGALGAGTALTGTATATFGQSGAFGAQAALAGTTTVTFSQSGDFVAGAAAEVGCPLLTEDGQYLLTEDGDYLMTETGTCGVPSEEDGLIVDGGYRKRLDRHSEELQARHDKWEKDRRRAIDDAFDPPTPFDINTLLEPLPEQLRGPLWLDIDTDALLQTADDISTAMRMERLRLEQLQNEETAITMLLLMQ